MTQNAPVSSSSDVKVSMVWTEIYLRNDLVNVGRGEKKL